MSYYYAEVKATTSGNKVVAWMDSTHPLTQPENGGDTLLSLTLTQYQILSAVRGNLQEAAETVNYLRKYVSEG